MDEKLREQLRREKLRLRNQREKQQQQQQQQHHSTPNQKQQQQQQQRVALTVQTMVPTPTAAEHEHEQHEKTQKEQQPQQQQQQLKESEPSSSVNEQRQTASSPMPPTSSSSYLNERLHVMEVVTAEHGADAASLSPTIAVCHAALLKRRLVQVFESFHATQVVIGVGAAGESSGSLSSSSLTAYVTFRHPQDASEALSAMRMTSEKALQAVGVHTVSLRLLPEVPAGIVDIEKNTFLTTTAATIQQPQPSASASASFFSSYSSYSGEDMEKMRSTFSELVDAVLGPREKAAATANNRQGVRAAAPTSPSVAPRSSSLPPPPPPPSRTSQLQLDALYDDCC
eukprot:PhM_4_TR1921/c1_g2_i1/m.87900